MSAAPTQSHCLFTTATEAHIVLLDPAAPLIIGRDPRCDLCLVSDRISRRHARIFFEGNQFVVEDLNSRSGVLLHDLRVARRKLEDGDNIGLGPYALRYRVLRGDLRWLLDEAIDPPLGSELASADYNQLELLELLTKVSKTRRSGELDIDSHDAGGRSGRIVFSKGDIVEATSGELFGLEALHALLGVRTGRFSFRIAEPPASARVLALTADAVLEAINTRMQGPSVAGSSSASDGIGELKVLEDRVRQVRAQKEQLADRVEFGNLFVAITLLMFVYSAALGQLANVPGINTELVTWALMALGLAFFSWMISRSSQPLASFGLTLHGARWALLESILFTLPALAAMLAIYRFWTHPQGPISLSRAPGMWIAIYAATVLVQEFLMRGAFQGSLERFLVGPRARPVAIGLTAMIFAFAHLHEPRILPAALVLGFCWGALYSRHRTLVGVVISHFLIGTLAIFLWGEQLMPLRVIIAPG